MTTPDERPDVGEADDRPRGDRFHDEHGEHRETPPDGEGEAVWRRAMRLHLESHGTAAYVRRLMSGQPR